MTQGKHGNAWASLVLVLTLFPGICLASQKPLIKTFPLGTSASGGSGIVAVDVNGDGVLDLITCNQSTNNVSVLLGEANLEFAAALVFPAGGQPKSLAVADFNRDGKPDIVTANFSSGTISVLFGNGDGTFQPHQDFSAGTQTQSVAVGDLNNDGIPDIVVSSVQSENTDAFLSNGDGTFQSPITFTFFNGYAAWTQIALADMNNDGILDFIGIFGFGQGFQVWLGRGDGSFSYWSNPLSFGTIAYPEGLAIGDFNGDGKRDVAVGLSEANVLGVSFNETGGNFAPVVASSAPMATTLLAVGDLNGDGKLDAVTTGVALNVLEIEIGQGNGTFQAAKPFRLGVHPNTAVIAPFTRARLPAIAFVSANEVGVFVP